MLENPLMQTGGHRLLKSIAILAAFVVGALFGAEAGARALCTLVADPVSGTVLLAEGDCETRVTPASTFKLPLGVMAFETGIITSKTEPTYPFKEGYADWVAAWRQDTDPTMWM